MSTTDPASEINSPWTLAGQKFGALLVVKRTSYDSTWQQSPEPGNLVTVQYQKAHSCIVRSIRSGEMFEILWCIFVPLKMGSKCCCSWRNCRCEIGDPEEYAAWLKDPSGNPTIPSSPSNSIVLRKIADPATLEGQERGAILVAKHKPIKTGQFLDSVPDNDGYEVGDFLELFVPGGNSKCVEVKNLRTGSTVQIPWEAFWPVGLRQVCDCYAVGRDCPCVYLDLEKSVEYDKAKRDQE